VSGPGVIVINPTTTRNPASAWPVIAFERAR
jgi:hypothetical protein